MGKSMDPKNQWSSLRPRNFSIVDFWWISHPLICLCCQWPFQEPIDWRYLSRRCLAYFSGLFFRGYPPNMLTILVEEIVITSLKFGDVPGGMSPWMFIPLFKGIFCRTPKVFTTELLLHPIFMIFTRCIFLIIPSDLMGFIWIYMDLYGFIWIYRS